MEFHNSALEYLAPGVVNIISITNSPYCDKSKSLWKSIGVKFDYYEVDMLEFPEKLIEEFHELSKI